MVCVCVFVCVRTRTGAQSCPTLWRLHGLYPSRILCPWNFLGKNTGAGCHFFLQGIFPTQRLNPHLLCLLHCQAGSLPTEQPSAVYKYINTWLTLKQRFEPPGYTYTWIFSNNKYHSTIQSQGIFLDVELSNSEEPRVLRDHVNHLFILTERWRAEKNKRD